MSTETLKKALAQKILAISDKDLLIKIEALLENEDCIGYNADGKTISANDFVKEMELSIENIKNNKATLFTTKEVRKNILDANNLG
tara:strand:+ start:401 stop:658 length:258 start_codon:yes stop_codon:yes gene_type:complete